MNNLHCFPSLAARDRRAHFANKFESFHGARLFIAHLKRFRVTTRRVLVINSRVACV